MIGKSTVIVEDRLKEMFAYLPTMLGADANLYPVVFKSGDQKELLAFFQQSQGKTNYPLLWLEMPYQEKHINRKRVDVDRLSLILAVETNAEILNSERLENTFKPILYPLLDRVLDVFTVSNTLDYDSNFEIMKFSNYSDQAEGEAGTFADIWDAIKLTLDVSINDNCLREIKI